MENVRGKDVDPSAEVKPKAIVEPPADWPQHGAVEFRDISMSYRDGPLVLKGVSLNINAREKVGFAGRTG